MHENRRTLKRRIRRAMFLCVLITLFLFTTVVIFLGAVVFKTWAFYVSETFSVSTAREMNSAYFLKQMGITGLENFNAEAPAAKEWLAYLSNPDPSIKEPDVPTPVDEIKQIHKQIHGKTEMIKPNPFINPYNLLLTEVTLNGKLVYSSASLQNKSFISDLNVIRELSKNDRHVKQLLSYYNVESTEDLFSSTGDVIGSVKVKMNDAALIVIFIAIASAIIFVAIAALIIAIIIGRFFAIPVSTPICRLEEQFRAVAAGDYEATMNAQISLKRPLREIESLAGSTNMIMHKMKEYNELMTAQNEELEAQNEELESQKEQIREAQTQLIQNEKMASVGQLTAAITHEINTPLGAVNSNVQLCDMIVSTILSRSDVSGNPELKEMVQKLHEVNSTSLMACNRITDIIRSLKNFSKLDQAEFQESSLEENLRSVLVLTSNLWKRNITIHEEYGALPVVKCFPGMLNQVFMNLVVNAIQAIDGKGDIYIKTYADEKYAYISIKDNGKGIKGEDLSRIFEAGYTTKKTGMGLGLSICTNIIDKHKGEIRVTSEPDKGTEFIVCIPLQNYSSISSSIGLPGGTIG